MKSSIFAKMKHLLKIESLATIDRTAREFIASVGNSRLLAFYGEMGAGKTTFTAALCRELGVADNVCSPTFTIVNEYASRGAGTVYHFDFYRIRKLSEALDIGVEDYFYSGRLCIMEWPENIEELLPEETLKIRISVEDDGSRKIEWEDSKNE